MKSRIISTALALFTFVFFTQLISNGTYAGAPILLSLIGAVIVGACVTQALANFKSFYHLMNMNELEPEEMNEAYKVSPWIFVVTSMSFCVAFYVLHKSSIEKELKDFGVTGVAEIVDGTQITTRSRNNSYSDYQLKLKFTDTKGIEQCVFANVSADVWNKVGRSMKVPIIYSSKNINFIKVVADVNTYLGEYQKIIEQKGLKNEFEAIVRNEQEGVYDDRNGEVHASRNVNVGDMMAFDTLPSAKMLDKLNSISTVWEGQTDINGAKWQNFKRGEVVFKSNNGVNVAVFHPDSICTGVEQLKYLRYIGFKEVSKDTSAHTQLRTYTHDDYTLTVKAEKHPTIANSFVKNYVLVRKNGILTAR